MTEMEYDRGDLVVLYEQPGDQQTIVGRIETAPPFTETIDGDTYDRTDQYKVQIHLDGALATFVLADPDQIVGHYDDTEPDTDIADRFLRGL